MIEDMSQPDPLVLARRLHRLAYELGQTLQSDVQIDQPDELVAALRAAGVALTTALAELENALERAGQANAAAALAAARTSQDDVVHALARAVKVIEAPSAATR